MDGVLSRLISLFLYPFQTKRNLEGQPDSPTTPCNVHIDESIEPEMLSFFVERRMVALFRLYSAGRANVKTEEKLISFLQTVYTGMEAAIDHIGGDQPKHTHVDLAGLMEVEHQTRGELQVNSAVFMEPQQKRWV